MSRFLALFLSPICMFAFACDDGRVDPEPAPEPAVQGRELLLAPPAELEASGLQVRQFGPPEGLVITEWGGDPIHRAEFLEAVKSCQNADPAWTCTLSWYQPDTTQPERVLGLGCSTLATYPLWKCYRDVWLKNGGKPI